jgi:hypothetical protein
LGSLSRPEPFNQIPLRYENAFGGGDTTDEDPINHEFEQRNPVGKGFRGKTSRIPVAKLAVPNIEDIDNRIVNPADRSVPQGFGYIGPAWQPRLSFAGTYDEAWHREQMPLLPPDFSSAFFNAAHPDLVYPGFVQGGEHVEILGTFPDRGEPVAFELPPCDVDCNVAFTDCAQSRSVILGIDRVHIDTTEKIIIMVAGAALSIENRFSVSSIIVE